MKVRACDLAAIGVNGCTFMAWVWKVIVEYDFHRQ
jgi:hypothetical protein